MFNKLKVMIFGGKPEKDRRRLARAGQAPKIGGHIVKQHMVIKVTDSMTQDLWGWFVLMGWREVSMRSNRRKLSVLPNGTFMVIAQANSTEREAVYQQQIKPYLKAA